MFPWVDSVLSNGDVQSVLLKERCSKCIAERHNIAPMVITKTCPCNIQRFFFGSKNEKCKIKNDNFLIFAQNIDCGYTLEPPR